MKMSRRTFLATSAAGAASVALPDFVNAAPLESFIDSSNPLSAPAQGGLKGRPKLCLSTYSLKNQRDPEGIAITIETAADLGVEAVDILHRSMPSEDNAYVQKLKQLAYKNGVAIACLSIHQDFVDPSAEVRKQMVAHTIRCLELAYNMGSPAIRLNSGSWGTGATSSYRDRVNETPIQGYTNNDGFGWIQDCIYKCIPTAEKCGVVMALENHWGLSALPEGMLRIKRDIKSDWLKFLLDTGNFLEDPYDKIAQVLPECIFLSCKTYQGGGSAYTLDLDYDRIFKMFYDVNFRGYITLEFEGLADPLQSSTESLKLFKQCIDKYYKNYPVK